MKDIIQKIKSARKKATQGEWKYAIDAPYVSLGDSNVILQVNSPDEARYIALLHNSIPEILDALEEAERKAKAGEELAEALNNFPDDPPHELGEREYCIECSQRIKKKLIDTYNKTVK